MLTTRAVARFQCLAAACEDDCCHGWSVPVERLTYDRLKDRLAATDAGRAELRGSLVRGRRPRDEAAYAQMRLSDDDGQRCAFLDGARLCTVHARFGPELLPGICASYPRVATRAGDAIEVHGFLSCPELARLALLVEDGLDLVPGEMPARLEVAGVRPPARAVALAALALPRPLPLRLLAPAGWDDPDGPCDHGRAAELVREVLASRRDAGLAASAFAALGTRDFWAAQRTLPHAALDPLLARYARAYWQREGTDLMMGTLVLVLRIALVRFLLLGQPAAELEAAAVTVVYRLARAVEHEAGFVAAMTAQLGALGDDPGPVARALAFG